MASFIFPLNAASYSIKETLYEGPRSAVYRAVYEERYEVAVKIVNSEDPKFIDGLTEVLKKKLNHPSIVSPYWFFLDSEMSENDKFSVWIVSPFASGGSILSIMAEKYQDGLPEGAIGAILRQVLVGILYLGRMGLSHGDLKGGNVLLHGDGTVQISDVWSSHAHYDKNYRRRNPPPYWLPEAEDASSSAYDMKSIGILALELAFGAPRLSLPHLSTPSLRFGYGIKNHTTFTDEFKDFVNLCFKTGDDIISTVSHLLHHEFFVKHATFNTISLMETMPPIHLRNTKTINGEDEGFPAEGLEIMGWKFVVGDMTMMPVMGASGRLEDLQSKYVKRTRLSFNLVGDRADDVVSGFETQIDEAVFESVGKRRVIFDTIAKSKG